MEPSFWTDPMVMVQLVLFFGLLGCSAFFSGTEVALFSLNQIQLQQMARDRHPRLAAIRRLLGEPRNLIATILIGNELVNVAASNISATLLIKLLGGEEMWWVNIFVMLPILLLVGEITPKTIAVRHNIAFAGLVTPPISLFMRLITPLRRVVRWVANIFITLIVGEQREKNTTVTEEMVRTLTEQAAEDGVLDDAEREYIHNIFTFGNLRVRDVMVPRARVVFLPKQATWQEATRVFQQTGLTRIPVYDGHRDDIVGLLHVRDMVKAGPPLAKDPQGIIKLLRKPYFVVETRLVSSLFQTFRERKQSMAMVVDEFGGLIGLVTMDDLLGTIFGKLHGPSGRFAREEEEINQTADGCYQLNGVLPLEEFNRLTGNHLYFAEFAVETLGGAIVHHLGELPATGQRVVIEGWEFQVKSVERNRIVKVHARRVVAPVAVTAAPDETALPAPSAAPDETAPPAPTADPNQPEGA